MKRGRGDQLTGGTGDISPQLLTMNLTMSAANTLTTLEQPLPINRFKEKSGRVVAVEALKIYWDLGEPDANPAAGGSIVVISANLSTAIPANTGGTDSRVFSQVQKTVRGAFTAAGSYGMCYYDPTVIDLTDGAGHGVVLATDNIFLSVNSAGFAAASTVTAKLLYRFKEISLQEYIGIVQSQQ